LPFYVQGAQGYTGFHQTTQDYTGLSHLQQNVQDYSSSQMQNSLNSAFQQPNQENFGQNTSDVFQGHKQSETQNQ